MKTLAISLILLLIITPAFAQLSDKTGLVNRLDVQTGGHVFEVETVANFNIHDFDFNKDEKKLTLYITSGLENNLGEVILPANLLGGDFTFYLNDHEFFPRVNYNERISFITLNFTGSGDNTIEIIGTTYLDGLVVPDVELPPPDLSPSVDNDYGLIYVTIIGIAIVVGAIIGVIVLVKRKN